MLILSFLSKFSNLDIYLLCSSVRHIQTTLAGAEVEISRSTISRRLCKDWGLHARRPRKLPLLSKGGLILEIFLLWSFPLPRAKFLSSPFLSGFCLPLPVFVGLSNHSKKLSEIKPLSKQMSKCVWPLHMNIVIRRKSSLIGQFVFLLF